MTIEKQTQQKASSTTASAGLLDQIMEQTRITPQDEGYDIVLRKKALQHLLRIF